MWEKIGRLRVCARQVDLQVVCRMNFGNQRFTQIERISTRVPLVSSPIGVNVMSNQHSPSLIRYQIDGQFRI